MQYPISKLGTSALLMLVTLAGCATGNKPGEASAPPEQTPAEAAFEAGAKRPPTAKTMFAMAKILATEGKDAQEQLLLKNIITQYPEFLPAYCELAEVNMRARRIDDAQRVLTAGLKRAPKDPILINDLGMCELMSGEDDAALKTFTKASGLAPDDARYRANMAAALGLLGRYDESLSLYQDVMSPSDAHYNLAVLCDARHDSKRAGIEYKKSAELVGVAEHRGPALSTDLPQH